MPPGPANRIPVTVSGAALSHAHLPGEPVTGSDVEGKTNRALILSLP